MRSALRSIVPRLLYGRSTGIRSHGLCVRMLSATTSTENKSVTNEDKHNEMNPWTVVSILNVNGNHLHFGYQGAFQKDISLNNIKLKQMRSRYEHSRRNTTSIDYYHDGSVIVYKPLPFYHVNYGSEMIDNNEYMLRNGIQSLFPGGITFPMGDGLVKKHMEREIISRDSKPVILPVLRSGVARKGWMRDKPSDITMFVNTYRGGESVKFNKCGHVIERIKFNNNGDIVSITEYDDNGRQTGYWGWRSPSMDA